MIECLCGRGITDSKEHAMIVTMTTNEWEKKKKEKNATKLNIKPHPPPSSTRLHSVRHGYCCCCYSPRQHPQPPTAPPLQPHLHQPNLTPTTSRFNRT
ncbi:uncharacterized protein LACBIDRAFT_310624 [Laccaria bicolor S238N-H82]|uniref:Predicted protein n=1 Tax=Laccaria bicolor (strain S238N-H82 / ATCC MYA-4686) TaxID=486041 RepID=B0DUR2_LACBS|nr:uncharacterized protein LACBIDRAFT_310624 [Laccaria bicolor S238N-H82]EDR01589.1 predicted protein [Laccaria bicolor S238N-H82]|eukprot:XP_001887665.1 predicted protein [Laccaria bicolor S238N-H82]